MWAPLLEKAWAKVKGNYLNSEGGYVVSGIRALTGVPTFVYKAYTLGTSSKYLSLAEAFTLIKLAEDARYIMATGTDGSGDNILSNSCGIA